MAVSHAVLNRFFSNRQGETAFNHVSDQGSGSVPALQSELWSLLKSSASRKLEADFPEIAAHGDGDEDSRLDLLAEIFQHVYSGLPEDQWPVLLGPLPVPPLQLLAVAAHGAAEVPAPLKLDYKLATGERERAFRLKFAREAKKLFRPALDILFGEAPAAAAGARGETQLMTRMVDIASSVMTAADRGDKDVGTGKAAGQTAITKAANHLITRAALDNGLRQESEATTAGQFGTARLAIFNSVVAVSPEGHRLMRQKMPDPGIDIGTVTANTPFYKQLLFNGRKGLRGELTEHAQVLWGKGNGASVEQMSNSMLRPTSKDFATPTGLMFRGTDKDGNNLPVRSVQDLLQYVDSKLRVLMIGHPTAVNNHCRKRAATLNNMLQRQAPPEGLHEYMQWWDDGFRLWIDSDLSPWELKAGDTVTPMPPFWPYIDGFHNPQGYSSKQELYQLINHHSQFQKFLQRPLRVGVAATCACLCGLTNCQVAVAADKQPPRKKNKREEHEPKDHKRPKVATERPLHAMDFQPCANDLATLASLHGLVVAGDQKPLCPYDVAGKILGSRPGIAPGCRCDATNKPMPTDQPPQPIPKVPAGAGLMRQRVDQPTRKRCRNLTPTASQSTRRNSWLPWRRSCRLGSSPRGQPRPPRGRQRRRHLPPLGAVARAAARARATARRKSEYRGRRCLIDQSHQ